MVTLKDRFFNNDLPKFHAPQLGSISVTQNSILFISKVFQNFKKIFIDYTHEINDIMTIKYNIRSYIAKKSKVSKYYNKKICIFYVRCTLNTIFVYLIFAKNKILFVCLIVKNVNPQ